MTDQEGLVSSGIGFRVEKLLTVGLLVVPCIAILGASTHFLILSAHVSVLPLSFFTLQDHFDKAVDLLIPVFLTVGLLNLASAYAAGVFDDPPADTNKKKIPFVEFARRWLAPAAFLIIGLFVWLAHPIEERWQATLYSLIGALALSANLMPGTYQRLMSATKMGWRTIWATLISLVFLIAYITNNVGSAIIKAKKSSFAGEKITLIDNFTFGFLLIEDGKFKVRTSDGTLLTESSPIPRESKSIACDWGWSWSCRFTKVYGDDDKQTQDESDS